MRIFIGFSEVANFVNTYKKGFKALGHDTYTVVGFRNKYYPYAQYDVVLSEKNQWFANINGLPGRLLHSLTARLTVLFVFLKALFSCQVFYYNTGGNLLPFRLDYQLIKLFGKKLVVIFLGSEIRHWYLYKLDLERFGYADLFASCIVAYSQQNFGTLAEKKERVAAAETFADLILSQPGFAQLQNRPYNRVTVGLYLQDYSFSVTGRIHPLIVHAPSARGIKGTEFIEEALTQLENEGLKFEFRLIENMPNHELLALLTESDIVIDELNSDTIGVLSTEAMACGNAVLTGYIADFVKVPQPCPVVNTNRLTIYENVKRLILDLEYRTQLAYQGRAYVEEYHDVRTIAARELATLKNKQKYADFAPHFNITTPIPAEILQEERKLG
jgi:hypothetical protein